MFRKLGFVFLALVLIVIALAGAGFRLELDRPAYGVAAGQAAVLYEEGAVVGAGLIQA